MSVVGYVIKATSSRFFSQSRGNVGAAGGVEYVARNTRGEHLGGYKNAAMAMAAFSQFYGKNRIARWERRDLPSNVEQYVAIGSPLDPSEIWNDNLEVWVEPSQVPSSVLLTNAVAKTIFSIGDISGNGNKLVAVHNPVLIDGDPLFNDQLSVNMDKAQVQGFTVPTLTALAPPYTMIIVGNSFQDPGLNSELVDVDGSGNDLRLGVSGTGAWQVRIGASTITGGLAGPAPVILTVKVTPAATNFRVNGVAIGSVAAVPDSGSLVIGTGPAGGPHPGRFAFLMIADIADADNTKIMMTERYVRSKYGRMGS